METTELKGEWVFMTAEGWKHHFCPLSLLSGLLDDAYARGHEVGQTEDTMHGHIDQPGMIMTDRTYQNILLGEFNLEIPTEDFEHFYERLKSSSLRTFSNGKEYYKLHGWLHCVVFTPEFRLSALKQMEEILPAVLIEAEKEHEEFTRRISAINKGGVRVMTRKVPESMPKAPMSGNPNDEKN